jgi:hypothetical protein
MPVKLCQLNFPSFPFIVENPLLGGVPVGRGG